MIKIKYNIRIKLMLKWYNLIRYFLKFENINKKEIEQLLEYKVERVKKI